jgi:hypothetical protein
MIETAAFTVGAGNVLVSIGKGLSASGCMLWIQNTHATASIQIGSVAQLDLDAGHVIPPGQSLDAFAVAADEELFVSRVGTTNSSCSIMRTGVNLL